MIETADGGAYETLKQAYIDASDQNISTEAFSLHTFDSATLRLFDRSLSWQESAPDLFGIIMRITAPLDGSEQSFDDYQQQTFPVKLYIADDNADPIEPLSPLLRSRVTAGSTLPMELELLSQSFADLKNGILSAFQSQFEENLTNTGEIISNLTNYDSYDNWDECLADANNDSWVDGTRDAIYGNGGGTLSMVLRNTTASVFFGALHTEDGTSNVASFSEAGVDLIDYTLLVKQKHSYGFVASMRQTTWFTHQQLKGSAARYLPDSYDAELSDKLIRCRLLSRRLLLASRISE